MQDESARIERPRPVGDRLRRVGGRRHRLGAQRVRRCRDRRHARRRSTPASTGSTRPRSTATGSRSRSWAGPSPGAATRWSIASKVAPQPEGTGFRPEQVRRACEASLGAPRHRRDRPLSAALARRAGHPDRGHLGRHGGAAGSRQASVGSASRTSTRTLIERCDAIRHVDSLQPEFSMLNRRQRGADPLVRRAGDRASSRTGRWRSGCSPGAITAGHRVPRGRLARQRGRRGRSRRGRRRPVRPRHAAAGAGHRRTPASGRRPARASPSRSWPWPGT